MNKSLLGLVFILLVIAYASACYELSNQHKCAKNPDCKWSNFLGFCAKRWENQRPVTIGQQQQFTQQQPQQQQEDAIAKFEESWEQFRRETIQRY